MKQTERPTHYQMQRTEYRPHNSAAEHMQADATDKAKQAADIFHAAQVLTRMNAPATPEGWYAYTSVYGTQATVEYGPEHDSQLSWSSIARTIADLRNAYHVPALTRQVQTYGETVSNTYTGSVDIYGPYDDPKYGSTPELRLTLRISTGSAMPSTCHIERTVKKVRKTIEQVELKVVCN